jgi:hypothetical protein
VFVNVTKNIGDSNTKIDETHPSIIEINNKYEWPIIAFFKNTIFLMNRCGFERIWKSWGGERKINKIRYWFDNHRVSMMEKFWRYTIYSCSLFYIVKKRSINNYFIERCTGGPKAKDLWLTVKPFLTIKGSTNQKDIIIQEQKYNWNWSTTNEVLAIYHLFL